jgi:hypothetical protein
LDAAPCTKVYRPVAIRLTFLRGSAANACAFSSSKLGLVWFRPAWQFGQTRFS